MRHVCWPSRLALAQAPGEDGEVVLLAEQFPELVGVRGPGGAGARRRARAAPVRCEVTPFEHFGGVAQVLDALAPLVHGEHALALAGGRRAGSGARPCR